MDFTGKKKQQQQQQQKQTSNFGSVQKLFMEINQQVIVFSFKFDRDFS